MPHCNLMQLTSNTNQQTIIPVCQKLILVHCSIKQGSVDLVICFILLLQILYTKSWNSSMALVILCYWHHLNLSLTPTMPKWVFVSWSHWKCLIPSTLTCAPSWCAQDHQKTFTFHENPSWSTVTLFWQSGCAVMWPP
jgi:hypothetical protein